MKLENIMLPDDTKKMLAECKYIYIPESRVQHRAADPQRLALRGGSPAAPR